MAETLHSAEALKMTTSPTQSHKFLSSPKLHSPNEGEIEEALHDDTNDNQSRGVLMLKKLECCFSGYEQDSELDTETLKTAVIQDSPSGNVVYDATLVGTDMVVPEIEEPPSSCVVKFPDDAIDSRNEKNREEKFADDSVYSRTGTKQERNFVDDGIDLRILTKQEGNFVDDGIDLRTVTKQQGSFADDAIDSSTAKKQEGFFADYAIDSSTVKKQKDNFADDGIDSRTVTKPEGHFADDAIVSSTVKKQEDNFSRDDIDSRTVTKQEKIFSDYAIYSSTVKKRERKFADDNVDSKSVMKLEGNFSDAICSGTVNKQKYKFADDSIDSRTTRKKEDKFSDDGSRTVKKQEKFESVKCALKIQVIDETALIESPRLGYGTFNNGKRQKTQGTKEKRPTKRSSKAAEKVETSGTQSQDYGYIGNKGKKRLVYSRKKIEALRFVGLEAQKKKWIEIYCGLGPLVAKEYDELSHHQKHNARTQFLRVSVPPRYLGAVAAKREGNHLKVSVR
ncbi:uncharacterized protein LOC111393594 [Olea europaea var. sylvestris]|uniref:uncharacterized protein LOC111393594 n=1 Tax=Olea europaea var. sylvestris TaxID=158386 RepID=UPI000C1D35D8|nr:uncharacterized protein LOC111393594 [Olea europaea var. sylvestris]